MSSLLAGGNDPGRSLLERVHVWAIAFSSPKTSENT
jgi:hypothetical protein